MLNLVLQESEYFMFSLHKSRDIDSQLTQRLLFLVFPGPRSLKKLTLHEGLTT
jgi:hypothetical protein